MKINISLPYMEVNVETLWLEKTCFIFVGGGGIQVQISFHSPTTLNEVFHIFSQFFQANCGIVP
jgi:hypothetical protein